MKQMIWDFRDSFHTKSFFFFRIIPSVQGLRTFISLEVYRESRRRSAVSFPALTYHANATRLTHCADDSCWHFVIVTTSRIFSVTLRMAIVRENGTAVVGSLDTVQALRLSWLPAYRWQTAYALVNYDVLTIILAQFSFRLARLIFPH